MDKEEAKRIIEALLFVSDKPVSIDALREVLKGIEATEIRGLIEALNGEYASSARSFSIKEIAGGFQMMTDPIYSKSISALYKRPPDRLTGPGLETLAIIAYKQPITRNEIEAIRGVNVDGVLGTLEERGLIRTRGRLEAPGRPMLYGTTSEFLQHFGLKSLEELPKLKEFKESDLDFVRESEKHQVIDKTSGKAESVPVEEPSGIVKEENSDGPKEIAPNS
ncbi:MAG: SMC-Scp complex subunit ScpB [Candidatus Omnitrophota bacterium]